MLTIDKPLSQIPVVLPIGIVDFKFILIQPESLR